jgi:hypothetical protein
MGLMSRALNTAHPDAGGLLKRARALRSRVTADLSTDRPPAATAEKKKPSKPYSPRRSSDRRRRRAQFFSVSRRCLTA